MNGNLQIYEVVNNIPSVQVLCKQFDNIQTWPAVDITELANTAEQCSFNISCEF